MLATTNCRSLSSNCIKVLALCMLTYEAFFTVSAHAHSGGTDANGCHAGSQPYHCHNGSKSESSSSSGRSTSGASTLGGSQSSPLVTNSYSAPKATPDQMRTLEKCEGLQWSNLMSAADKGDINIRCGDMIMRIKSQR